jgi:hypothetical protein
MHDEMARCLRSYRRVTPGPATAIEALDRIAGTVHFAEEEHKRRKFQSRCNDVARWKQELGRR